jgi:curved DNA-binding protein CbpA
MSFYSDLDDVGRKLYDDYIKAKESWVTYCKPKVFSNFNDYLNKTNRKFYRYEYYISKYECKDEDKNEDKDEESKKIYKILLKNLHPDKFNKYNSDKLFAMINKAMEINDANFLQKIFSQLELILNFTDEELDDFIVNIDKKDLESTNIDSFFNSMQYKLFSNPAYKKEINYCYITEEDLIKEIESNYDLDFVKYYAFHYKDNENIKKACIVRMAKENEKLLKENEYLRNKFEELRKHN